MPSSTTCVALNGPSSFGISLPCRRCAFSMPSPKCLPTLSRVNNLSSTAGLPRSGGLSKRPLFLDTAETERQLECVSPTSSPPQRIKRDREAGHSAFEGSLQKFIPQHLPRARLGYRTLACPGQRTHTLAASRVAKVPKTQASGRSCWDQKWSHLWCFLEPIFLSMRGHCGSPRDHFGIILRLFWAVFFSWDVFTLILQKKKNCNVLES